MEKFLIAEIGNNHFGDIGTAYSMILAARDSGANLVKFQAIDKTQTGSMPASFYEKCSFSIYQYRELMEFGKDNGIPVFFSIFHEKYRELAGEQSYSKIAASQTERALKDCETFDFNKTFVSFKETFLFQAAHLKKATPLYATSYMPIEPGLDRLAYLAKIRQGKPYGYSCHYIGPEAAIIAAAEYGVTVIEKHFTLRKNQKYKGIVFRDTIHGSTPKELELIAKELFK